MNTNRINLDWTLNTPEERTQYVNEVINAYPDLKPRELNHMAEYILWASDSVTLKAKGSPWNRKKESSLDQLIEEAGDLDLKLGIPSRTQPRVNLNRKKLRKALKKKSSNPNIKALLDDFEELWREIDKTELILNFGEISTNKRTKDPRSSLLEKFSPKEQKSLRVLGEAKSEEELGRLKRHLVELRQSQYPMLDAFRPTIQNRTTSRKSGHFQTLDFEDLVQTYPLPFTHKKSLRKLIYPENGDLGDLGKTVSLNELSELSEFLWRPPHPKTTFFSFLDPLNLRALVDNWYFISGVLEDSRTPFDDPLAHILRQFLYYKSITPLSPPHLIILEGKMDDLSNQKINNKLRECGHPGFGLNYISTLYTQKVLGKIADTVKLHSEIVADLMFPENFCVCDSCGRTLYRSSEIFPRRKGTLSKICRRCGAKGLRKLEYY